MSEFEVDVRVTPREGLLDPQGNAVAHALRSLDFEGVEGVRVGKLIRLRVAAPNAEAARAAVGEMCRKLLANPVTEDWAVEVRSGTEAGGSQATRSGASPEGRSRPTPEGRSGATPEAAAEAGA